MSKAILELTLKRDRLVNDGNTRSVGSREPREQSATELVRAGHTRGREEDTSITTEKSLPSTTSSHRFRLITATRGPSFPALLFTHNVSWLLLLSPGSTSVLASSRRTLGAEPRLLMRTTRAVMEDMQTRVTMHEMPDIYPRSNECKNKWLMVGVCVCTGGKMR